MQERSHWRSKVQGIFQVCQNELKRTTKIGKKMISASKTNTNLHGLHEELGELVMAAIEEGTLTWEDPKAQQLIHDIRACQENLEAIEKEVDHIRFEDKKGRKKE